MTDDRERALETAMVGRRRALGVFSESLRGAPRVLACETALLFSSVAFRDGDLSCVPFSADTFGCEC